MFDRIRSEHEFILLYHGRHEWTREDAHRKNTHHLLLGFAEFIRQHPDVAACLVTVEYGRDVGASKAMIADLGFGDRVIWFPRMYRKDLMYLVDVAHLCAGQFDRSFLTFGTILEALSVGKPVIHHRDDALYRDIRLLPDV